VRAAATQLRCRSRLLALRGPVVMGVLNVTPDSFFPGSRVADPSGALSAARAMVGAGAAIIDVGGESTRPGARPPALEEELARTVPVVRALAAELDVVISIDTSRAEVIAAAAEAGATLVNDVRALTEPGALEVCAEFNLGVCVMHMQGTPPTMQNAPVYADVVGEVRAFLAARVAAAQAAGIAPDAILVDPGFGFGKTTAHNLALLAALEQFTTLGCPLAVGLSRKSLAGSLTGRAVGDRLAGSIALAALAARAGALVVRAHDVAETVDAVAIGAALRRAEQELRE
jgi:dihydropteroate synthase